MSDIFHEVDEEVRRDQLAKLWERYGSYAIALAVVVIAAIAGWRGYEWWESKKAAEAGAAFEAAITLSEEGKHAEAEAAFAKLAVEGTSGYRVLARLRVAAELAQRDPKEAVKAYDELAASSALDQTLQDLAALRAGFLLADSASFAELRRRLDALAAPDRTFRHSARELLAMAAWRTGDITAARRFIDMIATDAETPQGTPARIDVLSALIAADGKS